MVGREYYSALCVYQPLTLPSRPKELERALMKSNTRAIERFRYALTNVPKKIISPTATYFIVLRISPKQVS